VDEEKPPQRNSFRPKDPTEADLRSGRAFVEGKSDAELRLLMPGFYAGYRSALRGLRHREVLLKATEAAFHALRSYQYGNASPELAEEVADACEAALKAEPPEEPWPWPPEPGPQLVKPLGS
jgi:hypothetical protein